MYYLNHNANLNCIQVIIDMMVHMLVEVVGLGWIEWLLLRWVVIVALLVDIAVAEHFFDEQTE